MGTDHIHTSFLNLVGRTSGDEHVGVLGLAAGSRYVLGPSCATRAGVLGPWRSTWRSLFPREQRHAPRSGILLPSANGGCAAFPVTLQPRLPIRIQLRPDRSVGPLERHPGFLPVPRAGDR